MDRNHVQFSLEEERSILDKKKETETSASVSNDLLEEERAEENKNEQSVDVE